MAQIYYNAETKVGLYEDPYELYGNPYVIKKGNRIIGSFDEKCEANRYYNWLVNMTKETNNL